jgi:protein TonB
MRTLRLMLAVPLALAITLSLFLFMYRLISAGGGRLGEREPLAAIRFGEVVIPDEVAERSRRKPTPPPPRKDLPPPPRLQVSAVDRPPPEWPSLDLPRLDVPLVSGAGIFIGNFEQVDRTAEGDIVPVVVIRPMYPREAAIAGIEGWVKVEFTITETGTVKDPRIVEADPPRIFNREAIRAILKWKFKPRVVSGVAVERRATQVIDFTLSDTRP